MSSTTSSALSRPTSGGSALSRLTVVEARLLLREPSAAFFVALFPAVLLTVLTACQAGGLPFDPTVECPTSAPIMPVDDASASQPPSTGITAPCT